MINATNARALSDVVAIKLRTEENDAKLNEIEKFIVDATNKGKYEIYIDTLNDGVKAALHNLGYQIYSRDGGQYDPDYYEISWKPN